MDTEFKYTIRFDTVTDDAGAEKPLKNIKDVTAGVKKLGDETKAAAAETKKLDDALSSAGGGAKKVAGYSGDDVKAWRKSSSDRGDGGNSPMPSRPAAGAAESSGSEMFGKRGDGTAGGFVQEEISKSFLEMAGAKPRLGSDAGAKLEMAGGAAVGLALLKRGLEEVAGAAQKGAEQLMTLDPVNREMWRQKAESLKWVTETFAKTIDWAMGDLNEHLET